MIVRHNLLPTQMIKLESRFRCFAFCFTLLAFLISFRSIAQSNFDSTGLKLIDIKGDSLKGFKSETKAYQRIIGSVIISHDGTTMTCDSAHFYFEKNSVEAFSNVHIQSNNGTQASGDYMRYTGHNHTAYMQGNVRIIDAANTLFTEELIYNVKTKIGKYEHGGTLQSDETTVSSNRGTYNGYTKQSYFAEEVIITNPKYTIESEELTYNTKSKVVKFLRKSTIISENATIQTSAGTYDAANESAVFTKRTSVENAEQIITGNTLRFNDKTGIGKASGDVVIIDIKNNSRIDCDQADYNRTTGYGKAIGHVRIEKDDGKTLLFAKETEYNKKTSYAIATGNVVIIDTTEKSKLLCGQVEYNENSSFMLATIHPKLITRMEQDSLYMRADTMIRMRARDDKIIQRIIKKEKNGKLIVQKSTFNLLYADSTAKSENQEEPTFIIAYKTVKVYSDSMQAVCDSLHYSQIDSIFRFFKSPVLWSKSQQSVADTIFAHTIANKISEAHLIGAAFIISETGYKPFYDQVSGNFIDAFFQDNQLHFVHVNENAESLYYAKDENEAYIGLNRSESAKMNVYFKNKQLDHLVMLEQPKGKFLPIDQISENDKFLPLFKLYTHRKPLSKKEILNME